MKGLTYTSSWGVMREGFSEFTYGFALTNEIISVNPVLSVPIFPSLVEEGRGAGYDVRLDRPGRPLFIQFKLSRLVRGRRAIEFQNNEFYAPFYRMSFRARSRSRQHDLLLDLEQQNKGGVYYFAPAFHNLAKLNECFERRTVSQNSRRVRPSDVNIPDDRQEHWLSFQTATGGDVYVHSEEGRKVEMDERPFAIVLAEQREMLSPERPLEYELETLLSWFQEMDLLRRTRELGPLETSRHLLLAHVAEAAQLVLGATLFIIQERDRKR
jgi:hypothetical protein